MLHVSRTAEVHQIAILSFAAWTVATLAVHIVSVLTLARYRALSRAKRLGWCNKIASALHAMVLVCGQAPHLTDPNLIKEPLHAVSDAHFRWGAVFYGYLMYDTAYSLAFYRDIGSPDFLLHHALGFLCCYVGLHLQKMALFGMLTQVVLEATTPALHLLRCLKLMSLQKTRVFRICGVAFVAQFFLCRVVLGNAVLAWLTREVWKAASDQVWAWAGVVLLSLLSLLNLFWFCRIVMVAARTLPRKPELAKTAKTREKAVPSAMATEIERPKPTTPFNSAQLQPFQPAHLQTAVHAYVNLVARSENKEALKSGDTKLRSY